MGEPYSGGCMCGAVRYEIGAEPIFCNACQCRDCQRESGAGHGAYLSFHRAGAKVTGEADVWEMTTDSGNLKRRSFCPKCGVAVYMTYPATPDVITVRAGSLDDPGRFKAQVVTYASRALAWDLVDPALPKFERMPG